MWKRIVPYWLLIFTIGFGWFILAPLVNVIATKFNVSLTSVLFIISAYGYTMAILGLLAGYISSKFTVKVVLYSSAILTFIGLLGRELSQEFLPFLIFSIIAAIAYPLAVAPVGNIAQTFFKRNPQAAVGISIGVLFLGMSIGSFVGPSIYSLLGFNLTLLIPVILSIISLAVILVGIKDYPKYYTKSLKGAFKIGMIKNWYVGLAVASILVMLGSVGSLVLEAQGVLTAVAIQFGGLFSGLSLLGSALGSIILPSIFKKRIGAILTGLLTFFSTLIIIYSFFTLNVLLISLGYFIFGFFGNAYWSIALALTVAYVNDPAEAGLATSMYSVISNVGVAIIPVFLGSLFANPSTIPLGGIIVIIMELISAIIAFTLKTD
ncbi:MAG: MFS transporter [Saccharolobus sp.]